MNFNALLLKTRILFPRICLGLIIGTAGAVFLWLYPQPKALLPFVDWLIAEGSPFFLFIGAVCLLFGMWLFVSSLKKLFSHRLTCSAGPIVISIHNGLFEQMVSRLWAEFFHRDDLNVSVSIQGNTIHISGQVPPGAGDEEKLLAFLSQRLLASTGYWGTIFLHTASL